ncbi:hypothetical protein NPIL_302611 [Nephila pilipes]|uniref:Uncharacterized protein n=1 Tax=Nephila pilipes TaxID=299642 RepID=A0A8X6QF28_NEPPI|nr:hypothetical protein NPIL_302611 [Nephila pilipes]
MPYFSSNRNCNDPPQLASFRSAGSPDLHDVSCSSSSTVHVLGQYQDNDQTRSQDIPVYVPLQYSLGLHMRMRPEFVVRIPFYGLGESSIWHQKVESK